MSIPEQVTPPIQRQIRAPHYKPLATYAILGFTILVYILQMLSEMFFRTDWLILLGANHPDLIAQGQIWRLLTPVFLHGSLLHIGFNMYALLIIGKDLETVIGYKRFLALYFSAGFAGNVLSFLFTQAWSLGSSTAIFGLLAAEGIFIYQNRAFFGSRAKGILNNILLVAGINLVIGLSPGIDNWGHMGGLLGGLLFGQLAGPKWEARQDMLGIEITDQHNNFTDTVLGSSAVFLFFGLLVVARLNGWI